jgi:acyl carrier protein phosphodiesterase
MNYLMHLFLSGSDPEILVGNMMGDFVKGRLDDRFSPGIRRGLEIHRKIDSFAAGNEYFLRSKHCIDPCFGHFRAVLVDIFYDHFLARYWEKFSPVNFEEFIRSSHQTLSRYEAQLPPLLLDLLPRMFSRHWLIAYRETAGIETALRRMSQRVIRANPLAEGAVELSKKRDLLLSDFQGFLPEVCAYADSLISR